jgi:NifU-like protein involved in Fe-S cluster formation
MPYLNLQELLFSHCQNPFKSDSNLENIAGSAIVENLKCGDKVEFSFSFSFSANDFYLNSLNYSTKGCFVTKAFTSLMCEEIKGRDIVEIKAKTQFIQELIALFPKKLTPTDDLLASSPSINAVIELLQTIPLRAECALLPWRALEKSLITYEAKK